MIFIYFRLGLLAMLTVYGDESSDATKQRVFAVAGLMGDADQWRRLEDRWVDHTGGVVVHAADLESEVSDEESQKLHRKLSRVLAESGIIGWGAAVDLQAVRRIFPNSLPHQPYLSCCLRVINHFAEESRKCIPGRDLEFIFDRRPKVKHNADLVYKYMTTEWANEPSFLTEEINFGPRECVGIQAADLWAREFMKRFASWLIDDRSIPRNQWTMLRNTHRFSGDFICSEYFEQLNANYEEICQSLNMKESEYKEWLLSKRRQDNQTNRIAHMMMIDARERKLKIRSSE